MWPNGPTGSMGEGKTGVILIVAVAAAVALAVAGIMYVRTRTAEPLCGECGCGITGCANLIEDEPAAGTFATSSGQDRVADVLNADDYLDEALNDLDAVNF